MHIALHDARKLADELVRIRFSSRKFGYYESQFLTEEFPIEFVSQFGCNVSQASMIPIAGELVGVEIEVDPVFGLAMPKRCTGVPGDLLNPRNTWSDKGTYDLMAKRLLALFQENFSTYADQASEAILGAAPGQ